MTDHWRELSLQIADEGRYEEFYRTGGWRRDLSLQNHCLADLYKDRCITLDREYRRLYDQPLQNPDTAQR